MATNVRLTLTKKKKAIERAIEDSDALLKQTQQALSETDSLFEKYGVDRQKVAALLDSDQIPAAERVKAKQDVQAFAEEMKRDAQLAAESVKQQKGAKPALRPSTRVRI